MEFEIIYRADDGDTRTFNPDEECPVAGAYLKQVVKQHKVFINAPTTRIVEGADAWGRSGYKQEIVEPDPIVEKIKAAHKVLQIIEYKEPQTSRISSRIRIGEIVYEATYQYWVIGFDNLEGFASFYRYHGEEIIKEYNIPDMMAIVIGEK